MSRGMSHPLHISRSMGKVKWWESGNGEWIVIEHLGREAKAKPRTQNHNSKTEGLMGQ